ncbi:MAG: lysophospholipid acyltransferase family protein [Candidatus Nanopelagicales bacterium]
MTELVYPPVIASMRVAFKLWGLRFDIVGADNIPTEGGAVLASNHVSYLDFIFCGFAADPSHRLVRFMAKDTVFKNHLSGPLMRGMKHIPVDRSAGADAFDSALDALKAGEVVGVFPEATISRSFEIKECKSGAARLAQDAPVPLIPMVTWGGQRMFSKGTPRSLRRGTCIAMTIGEPIYPDPGAEVGTVTENLRARLQELLEETIDRYPDKPRNDDDRWWMPVRFGGTAPTPAQAKTEDDAAHERRRALAQEKKAQATKGGEQS